MISPLQNSPAVMAYLGRVGLELRGLFHASRVLKENNYERDVAHARFNRRGYVSATKGYAPTDEEIEDMRAEVSQLEFPHQELLSALPSSGLPDIILNAHSKDTYIFRTKDNKIRFIQIRIDLDNGDKKYVPQTYWSDGQWRAAEPEEGLPIYNVEQVYKGARVFVHEGAKAARAATEIAEDPKHPWNSYFSTGVHVGWIGGAYHLHRNIWNELTSDTGELIIIPDNDFISKTRISRIARLFTCPAYHCRLDARWPNAWDVADGMPDSFYKEGRYQGPEFDQLLECCNWATVQVGMEGNRPIFAVREAFAQNWVRIQDLKHYAEISSPEISLDRDQFNIKVRPYSDVADTSALLSKISGNIVDKVTFMPSMPSGIVSIDDQLCLNQYVDRRVKPRRMVDTKPFWDFMDYLFEEEEERYHMKRWMSTLYGRPEVRMGHGVLMLSKLQGVGKSTLLDVLAKLIGNRHVSFPGDDVVQSGFNGWAVNKRLVVVHEIYAGQNWKTYNKLKSLVTDEFIEANNKHVKNYTMPNWTHYAAASNSMEALRMENDDRRWFVPQMPDHFYDRYDELYDFIEGGGIQSLAQDLLEFNDHIRRGEHAPLTAAKKALIDQSMPPDERMVVLLCERMQRDQCMDIKDIWLWLQDEAPSKAYISPQRIKSVLREKDYYVQDPMVVGSRERILVWKNQKMHDEALSQTNEREAQKVISSRIRTPGNVFKEDASM